MRQTRNKRKNLKIKKVKLVLIYKYKPEIICLPSIKYRSRMNRPGRIRQKMQNLRL